MFKLTSALLISALFNISIYTLTFNSSTGNQISFSSFQGKKILIVNIATSSPRASQIGKLQELQQQFPDSLIIVAFPSNSFGSESRSDSAIKSFCETTYNTSFLIAEKGSVVGSTMQPVYEWLTKLSQNGSLNTVIKGDFQKFLIDKNGEIIGIYSPLVEPMSQQIISAISSN